MDTRNGPLHVARRIANLAAAQHGVVSFVQLVELGLGRAAIQYRVAAGQLHALHVGVYAVGHPRLTLRGRWMAAVLACGSWAVLSHRDAAQLWQVRGSARTRIEVTVPGRCRNSRAGIQVHRPRHLDPRDCTVHDGIPVTTLARTLVDFAGVVRFDSLADAFETSDRLGLLDVAALADARSRVRRRRGLKNLDRLLADYRPLPQFTRSNLERRFLRLCEEHGIPLPATNLNVLGMEVDAVWPDQRVIVELDGSAYHGTRAARRRDPQRDADLQLARYRVYRVTDDMLANDPETVARTVAQLLQAAIAQA